MPHRQQILQLLSIISFSIFCLSTTAQKLTITGTVKDSIENPLPYTTVSLHLPAGTNPLRVTYADRNGLYQFKNLDTGSYRLIFSLTGYAPQQLLAKVEFSPTGLVIPDVVLYKQSKELKEVTVIAPKRVVEVKEDGISYNAEADPAAMSERLIDLLRKTPMVAVDAGDNVNILGQTNFRVLLNGRETALFTNNLKEALKSFPGSLVKRIEVITNPSAKYDAEGVGGIINIITKSKIKGYNGSLSAEANTVRGHYETFSFNTKIGKLGIASMASMQGNDGYRFNEQEFLKSNTAAPFFSRELIGSNTDYSSSPFASLELAYDIDSQTVVTLYGTLSWSKRLNNHLQEGWLKGSSSAPETPSTFRSRQNDQSNDQSLGTDFIHKLRKKSGSEVSIKTFASFSDIQKQGTSKQTLQNTRYVQNKSVSGDDQYTVQADYTHAFQTKQKLEMGVKGIFRRARSDYESFSRQNEADPFEINPANSDRFNYQQNVYGLYGSYFFHIKKYNFRTGLRWEHTTVAGNFISSNTKVNQRYNNLAPNFLLSTSYKGGHNLSLSYTLRLNRPYITTLNPFIDNVDSLLVYTGNPNLDPQIFHSASIRYTRSKGNNLISLTLGNSFSNSNIIHTYLFDANTGVTTFKPLNDGKSNSTYLFVGLYLSPSPSFKLNIDGNISYYKIKNTITLQANQGFSGSIGFNSSYTLSQKIALTGSATYYFPVVMLQGNVGAYSNHGVGIRYSLLKNKLVLAGRLNNMFSKNGEMVRKSTWKDTGFLRERNHISPVRFIGASITWNFGKLNEAVSKKRGVQNNDLL